MSMLIINVSEVSKEETESTVASAPMWTTPAFESFPLNDALNGAVGVPDAAIVANS